MLKYAGDFLSIDEEGKLAQVDQETNKDSIPHLKKRKLEYLKKFRACLVREEIVEEAKLPPVNDQMEASEIRNLVRHLFKNCGRAMIWKLEYIFTKEPISINSNLSDLLTFVCDGGKGNDLLCKAIRRKQYNVANLLIDYGAKYSIDSESLDDIHILSDLSIPLQLAHRMVINDHDFLSKLVRFGNYNVFAAHFWLSQLFKLQDKNIEINAKDYQGRTPLMWACSIGCHEYSVNIKLLLQTGADPNLIEPINGSTALIYALNEGNHLALGELLKLKELDIDKVTLPTLAQRRGLFALHIATTAPKFNFVYEFNLLLQRTKDIDQMDFIGDSALSLALKTYNPRKVKLLLEARANPYLINIDIEEPLSTMQPESLDPWLAKEYEYCEFFAGWAEKQSPATLQKLRKEACLKYKSELHHIFQDWLKSQDPATLQKLREQAKEKIDLYLLNKLKMIFDNLTNMSFRRTLTDSQYAQFEKTQKSFIRECKENKDGPGSIVFNVIEWELTHLYQPSIGPGQLEDPIFGISEMLVDRSRDKSSIWFERLLDRIQIMEKTHRRHPLPLHEAALNGYVGTLSALLSESKDKDLDLYDKQRQTPLMLALANGHFRCAKLLLQHGLWRVKAKPPAPYLQPDNGQSPRKLKTD